MVVELDDGGVVPQGGAGHRPLTRRQKYSVAALLLAAVALLVLRHTLDRPARAANSPPPYPASVAAFAYLGSLRDAVPGGHEFALRVRATALDSSPYQLVAVRQGYRGISTAVSGTTLPRQITPGAPLEFAVVYTVTDCSAAPRDAGMPFLDVTLRNARAEQTLSQILGPEYAKDLSRNLHITCPDSAIRTTAPVSTFADTRVRYPDRPSICPVSWPEAHPSLRDSLYHQASAQAELTRIRDHCVSSG